MFSLTHQERKALLFIGILILVGSILKILNINAIKEDLAVNSRGKETLPLHKGPVNINAASSKDLESISGIGEVIAGRIIDYRNQYGPFSDLEDLKKVNGIGDKKIESIKKHITFQ